MEQMDHVAMFGRINAILHRDWAYADRYLHLGLNNLCHILGDMVRISFDPARWPEGFEKAARRFLMAARDPSLHLTVPQPVGRWVGATLRGCGEGLFVEDALPQSGLRRGDEVLAIDARTVPSYRAWAAAWLYGEQAQREIWDQEMSWARQVVVRRGGAQERVTLRGCEAVMEPALAMARAQGGALVLRADRLEDGKEVARWLGAHEGQIKGARRVVLDLRHCRGRSEEAALALARLMVERPRDPAEVLGSGAYRQNRSEENRRLLTAQLLYLMEQDAQGREEYRQMLEELAQPAPSGWSDGRLPDEYQGPVRPLGACDTVLLTDLRCRGVAEQLARFAADCPRARTLGRATLGDSDTLMPLTQPLGGGYALTYCAARSAGTADAPWQGVPPQRQIDWTPAHTQEDVDLQLALTKG